MLNNAKAREKMPLGVDQPDSMTFRVLKPRPAGGLAGLLEDMEVGEVCIIPKGVWPVASLRARVSAMSTYRGVHFSLKNVGDVCFIGKLRRPSSNPNEENEQRREVIA
jgi:hypothetical protein